MLSPSRDRCCCTVRSALLAQQEGERVARFAMRGCETQRIAQRVFGFREAPRIAQSIAALILRFRGRARHASSVACRNVAESLHLFAMLRDHTLYLFAAQGFAPLVDAARAEKTLAFDRHLDETVATLHAGERRKARVRDRAFDAHPVFDADQLRDLAEMLGGLLDQIFVAQHEDARPL